MLRKLALCALAALLVVLLVAAGVYWSWAHIASDVKTFAPDGWAALEGHTELMVFPDRDVLVIRRAKAREEMLSSSPSGREQDDEAQPWLYYEYDPAAETLERVSSERWNSSHGHITRCARGGLPSYIQFDARSVYVTDFTKEMKHLMKEGRRRIRWALSPSVEACSTDTWSPPEERLAQLTRCMSELRAAGAGFFEKSFVLLLSADPDEQMSLMGHIVQGSRRQHYHQVASLKEGAWVGEPLRIPMVTRLAGREARPGRDYLVDICWSADERYVVYVGRTSLCIVPVEYQGD